MPAIYYKGSRYSSTEQPGNGKITIQKNGQFVDSFNLNQSQNKTINIEADQVTKEAIEQALDYSPADVSLSNIDEAGEKVIEDISKEVAPVQDVKIGNNSIVRNGIATIPTASSSVAGAVKVDSNKGFMVDGNGTLLPAQLNSTYIFNRTTDQNAAYRPITLNKLDDVVAAALADGKGRVYTDAEKLAARTRLGVDTAITNATSTKQDTIADLDTIRSGAALGATALQSFTETDPTVPAWAKEANKPEYSVEEILVEEFPDGPWMLSDYLDDIQYNIEYMSGMNPDEPIPTGKIWTQTDIGWANWVDKPTYTASEVGALPSTTTHLSGDIATSEKGAANGVATLDANGFVPSSQLPSYVDDVLEYTNKASFPTTGESGKVYIDTTTNITYRWSGSTYVPIGSDLALGETSSTAYAGDKGKAVTDAFNTHKADTVAHITAAERTVWNAKYNKPTNGIPKSDLTTEVQSSLNKADTALQSHQDISGKADKTTVEAHTSNADIHVTAEDKATWNAKSNFSGNYNDLTNKPTIPTVPTNVSAFTNDANYVKNTDLAAVNKPGLVAAGNWLTVNQTTGKMEAGELTKAQYDSADGKIFVGKTTLNNVLTTKQDVISDLSTIRSNASAGKTAKDTIDGYGDIVTHNASEFLTEHQDISGKQDSLSPTQMLAVNSGITSTKVATYDGYASTIASKANSADLATVATSGNYNDLSNKPTIPSAVTESTVSGWGFTKNTGTYSKPSTGIPKTDLASAVQSSLDKADTALQTHQDISGKANQTDLTNHTSDTNLHITETSRGNIETLFDTSHIIPKTISPVDDEFSLTSRNPVENRVITSRVNLISNPNLLDNPFFTVNQRSFTSKTSGSYEYTVDRWRCSTIANGASLTLSGSRFVCVGGSDGFRLYQTIEYPERFSGKTVTLSTNITSLSGKAAYIRVRINNVYDASYNTYNLTTGYNSFTITLPDGIEQLFFEFGPTNETTVTFDSVKLELGTNSTLMNDSAPNFSDELLKCQRFFYRHNVSISTAIASGWADTVSLGKFGIFFPIEMRATPSMVYSDLTKFRILGNGTNKTVTSMTATTTLNHARIDAIPSTDFASRWYSITLACASASYLDFSAEL